MLWRPMCKDATGMNGSTVSSNLPRPPYPDHFTFGLLQPRVNDHGRAHGSAYPCAHLLTRPPTTGLAGLRGRLRHPHRHVQRLC